VSHPSSIQEHSTPASRLEPTDSDLNRLPSATQNATRLLPEDADPDLAAVNAAWPDLPEAVRQSIMMLIRAAKG
jgi:hypothetical protein